MAFSLVVEKNSILKYGIYGWPNLGLLKLNFHFITNGRDNEEGNQYCEK